MTPGVGGHRPCLLRCVAQTMGGGGGGVSLCYTGKCLKPTGRRGYPFAPQESRGRFPQRVWKVPVLMSTSRQQGPAAALPGQDIPEDVRGAAKVAFREGAAGRNLLQAEWGGQRVKDREGQPEAGLQSGGPREDREQPELAVRDGRRQRLSRGGCAEFADM